MYKVNGYYVYLTDSQYRDILEKVAGHEPAEWIVSSHIAGSEANIEKHKRIQRYLENNFKEAYYKFNFYGKDAQDNIVNVLGEYNELSNAIDVVCADHIDYAYMMMADLTGGANIKNIKINIYEKIFFSWIFGRRFSGNSITIKRQDVIHIYGELTNFIVESKTFDIYFTIDNVNVTYK
ncbi:MAG: hypothetical protein IJ774_14865 [Selenomonadaceae bacterium]|nr:hypothetical protein [Selenomonadaceae bacterium]